MCFNEISVHPIIIHQIVLLARVLYKRNPTATCMRDLFLITFTFKGGEHWYWKSQYFIVLHFNCKHNSFLTWFDATLVSEVTIHRPNVSTFLSSALISGVLNAARRGPFIWLSTWLPCELSYIIHFYFTQSSSKLVKSLKTCLGSFLIPLSYSRPIKKIE